MEAIHYNIQYLNELYTYDFRSKYEFSLCITFRISKLELIKKKIEKSDAYNLEVIEGNKLTSDIKQTLNEIIQALDECIKMLSEINVKLRD